jgi:hypothetical protein
MIDAFQIALGFILVVIIAIGMGTLFSKVDD